MNGQYFRHQRTLPTGQNHTWFCFWDTPRRCWTGHLLGTPQYVSGPTREAVIKEADLVFDRMVYLSNRVKSILDADIAAGLIRSEDHMTQRCHALACIASQI